MCISGLLGLEVERAHDGPAVQPHPGTQLELRRRLGTRDLRAAAGHARDAAGRVDTLPRAAAAEERECVAGLARARVRAKVGTGIGIGIGIEGWVGGKG